MYYTYLMKSYIRANIDRELIQALITICKQERRSLKSVLEGAITEYLETRSEIITSAGTFAGVFSHTETYAKTER